MDWWLAAGITPEIAYQPKGAASLEDSYVNLANPGTYNAVVGVAPTLSADGWVFGGTSYLVNGLNLTSNSPKQLTVIIKYRANSGASLGVVLGASNSGDWIQISHDEANKKTLYHNGLNINITSSTTTGFTIAAISGTKAYCNGSRLDGTFTAGTGNTNGHKLTIGCRNVHGGLEVTPSNYFPGTVSAFFYTRSVLSEAQVLSVMTAMGNL